MLHLRFNKNENKMAILIRRVTNQKKNNWKPELNVKNTVDYTLVLLWRSRLGDTTTSCPVCMEPTGVD